MKGKSHPRRYSWWLPCLIPVSILIWMLLNHQTILQANIGDKNNHIFMEEASSSSLILKNSTTNTANQTTTTTSQQFELATSATTMSTNTTTTKTTVRPPLTALHTDTNLHKQKMVVSVYMNQPGKYKDYGYSFLENGLLQKYGELNYKLHYVNFHSQSNNNTSDNPLAWLQNVPAPCILLSVTPTLIEIQTRQSAPHCYLWLINDEFCKNNPPTDIRFYHYDPLKEQSHNGTKGGLYMPLGTRYDTMQAFRDIATESGTSSINDSNNTAPSPVMQIPPVHERRYVFNAIFTRSTSPSRKVLFRILKDHQLKQQELQQETKVNKSATQNNTLPQHLSWKYFLTMPKFWKRQLSNQHVATKAYVKVLQQSVFTLSPHGHNPECHRLFEAIQAGSIPVIVIDEEYKTHACPNAFQPFLEPIIMLDDNTTISPPPPIVVLKQQTNDTNGWDGLFDTLQDLMQDIPALQRRQEALLTWQHAFNRYHVSRLEHVLQKQPWRNKTSSSNAMNSSVVLG